MLFWQLEREGMKKEVLLNFYYWMVLKFALEQMPEQGFDVYLIDRKVFIIENWNVKLKKADGY